MAKKTIWIAGVATAISWLVSPTAIAMPQDRVETGALNWGTDLDAATAESRRSGKPVFLLFQEIPGCQTCQQYGLGPMSHPLIVEAIESEFVPVLVHNNRSGRDAAILKKYREPAWNNPVVRYLDQAGEDLIDRRDRVWTTAGTAERMVASLKAADRAVPSYLSALASDPPTELATFAMFCFWEGEAKLGSLDGVVASRAGWLDGREVVQVRYRPDQVSFEQLMTAAQEFDCARQVYCHTPAQHRIAVDQVGQRAVRISTDQRLRVAKPSDRKYFLSRTPLAHLPLTEFQATKLNAAVRQRTTPADWLSPRQVTDLDRIASAVAGGKSDFPRFRLPATAAELDAHRRALRRKLDAVD